LDSTVPGPNSVTVATATNLTGVLVGNGATVGVLSTALAVALGGTGLTAAKVASQFSPADPTATASLTQVMMGFGLAATPVQITPAATGNVLILVAASVGNTVASDGANTQLRYANIASIAAPANAAAVVGTALGSVKHMLNGAASGFQGVSMAHMAIGLTVGATYWIDIALNATTGGTTAIRDVDIVAIEI
jgi:hypothetical protein